MAKYTCSMHEQREFLDFMDQNSRVHELTFLGYPWNAMARETLNNVTIAHGMRQKAPDPTAPAVRLRDFQAKAHLLQKPYDYLFYVKSRMRRRDPLQIENPFFIDIFRYLRETNKSFLILESYENESYCDLKYLHSEFAEVTLPVEYLLAALTQTISHESYSLYQQYNHTVDTLFKEVTVPAQYSKLFDIFFEVHRDLGGIIPTILSLQTLCNALDVTGYFGTMGTHFLTGLKNPWSIIEMAHGYAGTERIDPRPADHVFQFYQESFDVARFYKLLPSVTEQLAEKELLCRQENLFNFGNPELRSFLERESAQSTKNSDSEGAPCILLCTSAWAEAHHINSLIQALSREIPEAEILLRPHPSYEDPTGKYEVTKHLWKQADGESKYQLFSKADVILTYLSSMVMESYNFTENVVVFSNGGVPVSDEEAAAHMQKIYPFAHIVDLNRVPEILATTKELLLKRKRKDPTKNTPDLMWRERFAGLISQVEGQPITEPIPSTKPLTDIRILNKKLDEAVNCLKHGDTPKALSLALEVKSVGEEVRDLNYLLALCYLSEGSLVATSKALGALETEVELFPDNLAALEVLQELKHGDTMRL